MKKKIIKQIIRGCGPLPYVGDHPGTDMMVFFFFLGGLAGMKGGFFGIIGGILVATFVLGPFYLVGAYDRANLSDSLQKSGEPVI